MHEIAHQKSELVVAIIDLRGGWAAIQELGLFQPAFPDHMLFFVGEVQGAADGVIGGLEDKTLADGFVLDRDPHGYLGGRGGFSLQMQGEVTAAELSEMSRHIPLCFLMDTPA